jgi:hypothetical protein
VLNHEPVRIEPQHRCAGERLLAALGAEDGPVLDRGAIAVDDRLAEPDLGLAFLVREGALDVRARVLELAKRMRAEPCAGRVSRGDDVDVVRAPAALPGIDPGARGF